MPSILNAGDLALRPGTPVRLDGWEPGPLGGRYVFRISIPGENGWATLAEADKPSPRVIAYCLLPIALICLAAFVILLFPRTATGNVGGKSGPFKRFGAMTATGVALGGYTYFLTSRKAWEEVAVGDRVEIRHAAIPPMISRMRWIGEDRGVTA